MREIGENIPLAPALTENALPRGPEGLPEPPLPFDIGTIAEQYLLGSYGKDGDKTFGLKNKDVQFYLANAKVFIDGNDLVIENKRYRGTQGLWDLIVIKS